MLNIMCAQRMSRRDLNELTDTALTTCTGRLFYALTTRIEKNFSLRVVEHIFLFSLLVGARASTGLSLLCVNVGYCTGVMIVIQICSPSQLNSP